MESSGHVHMTHISPPKVLSLREHLKNASENHHEVHITPPRTAKIKRLDVVEDGSMQTLCKTAGKVK